MKVAKIQDIENLADGSVIGEMTAQVKAAFPAKTGEGKYGPWRVVAAILKDGTGEIRCSFWTTDDIQGLVGQTITIKSQAGNKGLAGISVKFSAHSKTNELNVSDKAAICDQGGDAVEEYRDAVKTNLQIANSKGGVKEAKRNIFQTAQLYVECVKAGRWIVGQIEGGLSPDHFQAVVASLFIASEKQGLAKSFPLEQGRPPEEETLQDEIPLELVEVKATKAKRPSVESSEFEEENGW